MGGPDGDGMFACGISRLFTDGSRIWPKGGVVDYSKKIWGWSSCFLDMNVLSQEGRAASSPWICHYY